MAGPWEQFQPQQTAPDGPWSRFRAATPEQPAPEAQVGQKADRLDAKPLTWKETADDYANSFGSGVTKGALALAGAAGDIRELGVAGAKYLFPNAEANRAKFGGPQIEPKFGWLPTSEQLTPEGVKYDPKTTAGEYLQTAGEFAPNALAPGGIVRKAAMVAAPAIASETAGLATKGTAAEPWARAGGALLGGAGAAGRAGSIGKVLSETAAETPASVRQKANAMFNELRGAGIGYDRDGYQGMAVKIMEDLNSKGVRAAQAPLSADALNAIGDKVGKDVGFNDVESLLETVGGILRERNATDKDKFAAGIIKDYLDDYAQNGITHTGGSLAPEEVGPLITQAREMARRNILAKQISNMETAAETYQSGEQAGLRNQFSNYVRSNKGKSLTPEERKAFLDVSHGYKTSERFGRLGMDFSKLGSKSMFFPSLVGGASYAGGDPLSGAALVAAATGAKYYSKAGTKKNVSRALATVLAGPEGQKEARSVVEKRRLDALARALLSGETASTPIRN